MANITDELKRELWKQYGSKEHPAEWDGAVYGGGKISQRFWEYFKAIEFLDLDKDSIVLNIGGGSPATGLDIFSSILQNYVKGLIVVDPTAKPMPGLKANVDLVNAEASQTVLSQVFNKTPQITHVVSISVLEHIPPEKRIEMQRAFNTLFKGNTIVHTFEFHPHRRFVEHQLTTKSLSELVSEITGFWLSKIEASPVHCENVFYGEDLNSIIPKWYPLIVKFERG
jgi:hypothetical protein